MIILRHHCYNTCACVQFHIIIGIAEGEAVASPMKPHPHMLCCYYNVVLRLLSNIMFHTVDCTIL